MQLFTPFLVISQATLFGAGQGLECYDCIEGTRQLPSFNLMSECNWDISLESSKQSFLCDYYGEELPVTCAKLYFEVPSQRRENPLVKLVRQCIPNGTAGVQIRAGGGVHCSKKNFMEFFVNYGILDMLEKLGGQVSEGTMAEVGSCNSDGCNDKNTAAVMEATWKMSLFGVLIVALGAFYHL